MTDLDLTEAAYQAMIAVQQEPVTADAVRVNRHKLAKAAAVDGSES